MHMLSLYFDCVGVDQGGEMLGRGWEGSERV